MIFKFGVLLLVGYVSRSSALPACLCTRGYFPVCGSDGRSYGNRCLLDCARLADSKLTQVHRGDCDTDTTPPSCVCTFEYKPVCGSDGETYPNQCSLRCQTARNSAVQLKHTGPCSAALKTEDPCVCTREMKPVCGTDGVTYANPCMLNCKAQSKSSLSLKHVGSCEQVKVAEIALPSSCSCTRNLQPVCGTDGVTYNNPCLLECAAQGKDLAMKSAGPCDGSDTVKVVERAQPASCACTRNYFPVCGSDGQTYPNPCMLGCASKDKPDLQMFHPGACGEESFDVVEQPVY